MTHYSRTKLYGLLCTWLCFCLLPVRAQDIASNSNSLIVDARTEVICKSMTQSVERETRTVTILNKKGLDAAHFFCSCDMFRSLQKFSGESYQRFGRKRAEDQKIGTGEKRIQFLAHHGRLSLLLRMQLSLLPFHREICGK